MIYFDFNWFRANTTWALFDANYRTTGLPVISPAHYTDCRFVLDLFDPTYRPTDYQKVLQRRRTCDKQNPMELVVFSPFFSILNRHLCSVKNFIRKCVSFMAFRKNNDNTYVSASSASIPTPPPGAAMMKSQGQLPDCQNISLER